MQYVLRRACLAPDDPTRNTLTVADVNALLDRLAATDADKKAQVGRIFLRVFFFRVFFLRGL
jgi:hypothetical protein